MMSHLLSGQRLFDVAWLLFLLLMFRHFWVARQVTLQTKGWVKTEAHITQCEWSVAGRVIWPKIEYSYQVDEHDYIGEYFFLDMKHNAPGSNYSRHLAYKVAHAYQHHEAIDVYYNPDKPEEAVLDRTVPRKINVILAALVVFIVLIVVHLMIMWAAPTS